MSLDIGAALRTGFDDLTSESGVLVVAVLVVLNLGSLVANESFTKEMMQFVFENGGYTPEQQQMMASFTGNYPLAIDVGLGVAVALALLLVLVGEFVRFWAIRTFAGPSETAVESPAERVSHVLVLGGGVAVLLFVFGSVAPLAGQLVGPLVGSVGSLVGSVGSLVLLTVFVYLRQEIALNDGGYGATVKNSFARFMDDPASIIVLLVVLGLFGLVAAIPTVLTFFDIAPGVAGISGRVVLNVVATVIRAVFQTLGIAAVTAAYLQVRSSAAPSGL
ncbi:hypothetical protein [Haloarcula sp. JP-L23]|uniref:hypothetical protein n=1 Tax=Haloarcula sp. JP-L23 TaxID=2716717 RepID=UPI00140EC941|nr:hypothetical protein G9465_16675 [Haloarcula sp. JP-L23]